VTNEPPTTLLQNRTTRGSFIKYGAAGAASLAAGGASLSRWTRRASAQTIEPKDPKIIDLAIRRGYVRTVTDRLVCMFGFVPTELVADMAPSPYLVVPPFPGRKFPHDALDVLDAKGLPIMDRVIRRKNVTSDADAWASFFPERVIVIPSNEEVLFRVANPPGELLHRFRICAGTTLLHDAGAIEAGTTVEFTVKLPPGTYLYEDPTGAGINRTLGLHGVLVVIPGTSGLGAWKLTDSGPEFERQYVWLVNAIDPVWCDKLGAGINPASFSVETFSPQFFTLNNRSGVVSCGDGIDEAVRADVKRDTKPHGVVREDLRFDDTQVGQLIRLANAGLAVHSLHYHGNHPIVATHNNAMLADIADPGFGEIERESEKDVVMMRPLHTKDVILPCKLGPDTPELDTPAGTSGRPKFDRASFPECDDGAFEMHFPMHCHAEMSQTAAGGLYPGGTVTDWILLPSR
jgi:hypothetical protein